MLTLPQQFRATGLCAGIKKSGIKDMALIVSDQPAAAAGTFTRNRFPAAPVKWCKNVLAQGGQGRAIVVNSGIANACTGERGDQDARQTAVRLAERLGVREEEVFVCSTGRIGNFLPMDRIEAGLEKAVAELSPGGGELAAEAILTTDTRPKTIVREMTVEGKTIRLTGMAKGAGMIEPNMATMLAFILTDAAVEQAALQDALRQAVEKSFNRISVDGDMSTNDTVLALANGAAGTPPLGPAHPDWEAFVALLELMAFELAMMIIGDGEGARKVVTVRVQGAAGEADAELAARAIANSLLVKTSWVGEDANWGRVMDALGYSGADVQETRVDIHYDALPAVQGGLAAITPQEELRAVVARPAFTITIDLNLGDGQAVVYSCDCTEEYVQINI